MIVTVLAPPGGTGEPLVTAELPDAVPPDVVTTELGVLEEVASGVETPAGDVATEEVVTGEAPAGELVESGVVVDAGGLLTEVLEGVEEPVGAKTAGLTGGCETIATPSTASAVVAVSVVAPGELTVAVGSSHCLAKVPFN
jgi:hypothetical protein